MQHAEVRDVNAHHAAQRRESCGSEIMRRINETCGLA
ncbi:hypothetical protein RLEG12_08795 (plasmid) [Rhizobium leguminosarum bv. trifolii CB782]|nr:hypothetical protein RLEG12_08795 [Rhizobium leguminosarum bv. trifolii CB782]